ncbi:MAG: hypothetical protein K8U03_23435 [Planctomycetia bacterium]|nr:hypothetical protein [Planctomycetia bacterium]
MLCRVVGVVALGLLLSVSQSSLAQAPQGTIMKVDGKVAQVTSQGLMVNGNDGKSYGLMFDQKSKVSVLGSAAPEFLAPKMFVQLDTVLDDKGMPTKEIDKLQIVQQSEINAPGVFSTAGPDAKPGAAGDYFVRGSVKTYKDGVLTVMAGPKPMTFKVSAAVSIPVTISDWGLASVGDAVSGDGQSFPVQGTVTPVYGERIEIKAVMPISKKKKGRTK